MNKTLLIMVILFVSAFFSPLLNAKVAESSFSSRAWNSIRPVYEKILKHPFNVQLSNGTLNEETFKFYKRQDGHYLMAFSKALAVLASKVSETQDIKLVLDFAKGSLAEKSEDVNISVHQITPANFAYTNFLLNVAGHGSKGEIAAALLPCFWIYAEVAKDLKQKSILNKGPYFKWISSYSSADYRKDVEQMILLTNRLFLEAGSLEKLKMHEAFTIASKLELHFWDDAFHHRTF